MANEHQMHQVSREHDMTRMQAYVGKAYAKSADMVHKMHMMSARGVSMWLCMWCLPCFYAEAYTRELPRTTLMLLCSCAMPGPVKHAVILACTHACTSVCVYALTALARVYTLAGSLA